MKLKAPSPALVVSIVALVVACGGTATAATLISSKNVKNNSLTGSDIKNKSLRGTDLANGTITSTQLNKSVTKKLGTGAAPAAPASSATEAKRQSGEPTRLTLQPGAYVIQAKVVVAGFLPGNSLQQLLSSTESATVGCTLDVGGVKDVGLGQIIVSNRPASSTIVMQMTRTLGAATDAVVNCAPQVPENTTNTTIIATKVGSVSDSASNG